MKAVRAIYLPQILPLQDPSRYKLHLARWNGQDQPLNVFVRDREAWHGWNRWRGNRNDFGREFIFSLMDFYPQKDRWLFGGIYQVRDRSGEHYGIELVPESEPFIGRLKLNLKSPGRSRAFYLENHYPSLIVDEILAEPYTGEPFTGFQNLSISFPELETLVATQRPDWRSALLHAKGIYLITDSSNGKRYVGSACGDQGIWSRWECYGGTGHGHNDDLRRLIDEKGLDHARQYFTFTLLEHFTPGTDDATILSRETFWKKVNLSRGAFGYNLN
jgi:hypothetical protein